MEGANQLLGLLYDRGEAFFGLGELATATGLDRRRLDRAIGVLRRRGQEIEFSPTHGVRLVRPVRLDAHLIERDLGTRRIGRSAICFEEVDSTSDVAFDASAQDGADGLVVLAEYQRRGRGRLGRQWLSQPYANILLSVLLIESVAPAHDALTVAAGLAVAEGIEEACALRCGLRWPNDVLLDGAKVAGVLVEMRTDDKRHIVVIGVGVNANAVPAERQIETPATNLAENLTHPVERTEVVRAVLRRLEVRTRRVRRGEIAELHDTWLSRCGMINERITVLCAGRRHVGRVLDVSPLEGLVLCCDDDRTVHLPAEGSTILHKKS